MIPAVKMMDPVMGVDVHMVFIPAPPAPPIPTPLPHPFVGMLMDPGKMSPTGAKVRINNMPAGIAGFNAKAVPPHIPMGAGFVPPPPTNDGELFMGSATVLADGDVLGSMGGQVLTCQTVGIPPPPRKSKPMPLMGLYSPTSSVMSIPAGPPVLVGGPPTITMMAPPVPKGGGGGKAKGKKKMGRLFRNKKAKIKKVKNEEGSSRNEAPTSACTTAGHPVDVATGKVYTDFTDFEINGPIPLKFERIWYSTSVYDGPVGHGWHHSYDWGLNVDTNDESVVVRLNDGRTIRFPFLEVGEEAVSSLDKIRLYKTEDGYFIKDQNQYAYYFKGLQKNQFRPLEKIKNANNFEINFEYNNKFHLQKIIDSTGRNFKIVTDLKGRIQKIEAPHPEKENEQFTIVSFHYDLKGNLARVTDPLGKAFHFKYRGHLLEQETNRNGLSFYFKWDRDDEHAYCTRTWGDGGIYDNQLIYNKKDRITTVTNALGHKAEHHYNKSGLVTKTIDANGAESIKIFDDDQQLIEEIDELGRNTYHSYDERGNRNATTFPDGSVIEMEYDERSQLIWLKDQLGGEWKWAYNENGILVAKSDPLDNPMIFNHEDGRLIELMDGMGNQTIINYDKFHNITEIINPNEGSTKLEYDRLGRNISVTNPNKGTLKRTIDLIGRSKRIYESDGNIRQLNYDAEGNLIRLMDKQKEVKFEYGGFNRMTARIESGTRVEFDYDKEDQLIGIKNEKGYAFRFALDQRGEPVLETGFDEKNIRYIRDLNGRIKSIQRPMGKNSSFVYDSMDRIVGIEHWDASKEQFKFDLAGRLEEAKNASTIVRFERDAIGNIIKENQGEHFVEKEFDISGLSIALRSSKGANISFERNQSGELTGINAQSESGEAKWTSSIQRDLMGLEIQRDLPGGIQSRWKRDKLGRPLEHNVFSGTQEFISRTYKWDFNNLLKEINDLKTGKVTFGHDIFGNLSWAEYPDQVLYKIPDAVGNLFTSQSRKDRRYSPAGQLLECTKFNYTYDVLGNLIQKTSKQGAGSTSYEWNASGMLTSVSKPDGRIVRFEYDALGRRISKTYKDKTTKWIWDGNVPLHEWVESSKGKVRLQSGGMKISNKGSENGIFKIKKRDQKIQIQAANAPPKELVQNSDLITWVFEPGNFSPSAKIVGEEAFSIISDHIGAPTAMFDASGKKVWSCNLNIYGEAINLEGELGDCPFRYPGQYEDVETGLYYNRFRYYDPESGGYISEDPIGLLGGNPSLYAYSSDINTSVDVLGLAACNSASGHLPPLRGMSETQVRKTLQQSGYTQTKVSNSSARNETWDHADGSQVRIHPYGNERTTMRNGNLTPKSGLNAHVHKQNPAGDQLNDKGEVSSNPDETHIGIRNPQDLPAVRNRPHGYGA